MAGADLAAISAALNLKYADAMTDQFRRDVVLANFIDVEPDANQNCVWDVKFSARTTAGPRAEGYDVLSGDFETHLRKQASLAWAHYEAYGLITGTAQRIAAANGRAGQTDKIGEELNDAVDEVTVKVGEDTYGGNVTASPVEIEGLARAVDSGTTYAGLAPGTYTEWVSGEDTLAAASLSLANIRTKLLRPFRTATGKNPSLVVTTGAVMDSIAALFDTTVEPKYVVGPGGPIDLAKLGFRAYMVEGVPFVEDRHCTAATLYALDLMQLKFMQVPAVWSSMDPGQLQNMIREMNGQTVEITDIQAAQARARRRISFQINALAKTGDSTKFQIVSDFQLKLKRRNAASKLTLT
jgi:hypothetical protein